MLIYTFPVTTALATPSMSVYGGFDSLSDLASSPSAIDQHHLCPSYNELRQTISQARTRGRMKTSEPVAPLWDELAGMARVMHQTRYRLASGPGPCLMRPPRTSTPSAIYRPVNDDDGVNNKQSSGFLSSMDDGVLDSTKPKLTRMATGPSSQKTGERAPESAYRGANVPFPEAPIPMLEPSLVRAEMKALQHHFREKKDFVLKRLTEIGFRIRDIPQATLYIWLDLTALELPLSAEANISDVLTFFNALRSEKLKSTSDNKQ